MSKHRGYFSIIVIPDTQNVSTSYPEELKTMAHWIVDHAASINLKMILHLGDVVNHGAEREKEYQNHQAAFDIIQAANIPMMIAIGNHDYDNQIQDNRDSNMFNHYCGIHLYKHKPWFGGTYESEKTENMYTKLNIAGRKYVFLSLEFGPRDEVLDWANQVLRQHHDHHAIILTHSYMYRYGERTKPGDDHNPKIYTGAHGANDGEDVWQKCIKHHKNVLSVYSGHHIPTYVSHRSDQGEQNNPVFQAFQNWQAAPNGGSGRFRIVEFDLQQKQVDLKVLNPQTNRFETEEGYEVSHPLPSLLN